MLRKRKKSFMRAHAMLQELRVSVSQIMDSPIASRRQLNPLHSLQKLLMKEIIRVERKIRRSKNILKELDASVEPERAAGLEERIEVFRQSAYIWRCFGDAIAFLFMDKFALKHTYYNTENLYPKQDAGFLADKEGLAREWAVVEEFLSKGFPALLSDLTNTIRYGDVCALLGPDPILIEVKSGKLDRRGRRQKRSIKQLMSFFETDEAEGFRGFEKLKRVAPRSPEITHTDLMNECIKASEKSGYAVESPETGVYYVAISDEAVEMSLVFDQIKLVKPWVFSLNELKATRQWSPYTAFVLSIKDRDALRSFIEGRLFLMVLVDTSVLRSLAESNGYTIKFETPNSDYAFELKRPGAAGVMQIGSQIFNRVAYEFTSPAWVIRSAMEGFDRHESELTSSHEGESESGDMSET